MGDAGDPGDAGDFIEQHNETDHGPVGIRAAGLSDASAIAAVHVAGWEGAYRGMVPDEEIDRRTVARRTAMWQQLPRPRRRSGRRRPPVGVRRGAQTTTIGFVSLGVPDGEAGTVEITALYVTPAAWRSGAGTALMRAALAEAAGRGISEVTLWVLEPNLRARAFYERSGFTDDGGRQTAGRGWPVELRMRRAL